MGTVRLTGIRKEFGEHRVLKGIDVDVADGEFLVIVGPSGCGKSTLLRAIAGLEPINGGSIEIAGRNVNRANPRDRNVAMVFQSYALYPFLNVFENIAFGLRARKTSESEIKRQVDEAARLLGLTEYLQRLPRQLSGGQRQRVAIGRAIVRHAEVFLFDEPLSNLDAQLRDEMRGELKRLHAKLRQTMIYVTHDQVEAMTLADRIMLMRAGEVEQIGTPLELFTRPRTRFVASFLGTPTINFLPGTITRSGALAAVQLKDGAVLPLPDKKSAALTAVEEGSAVEVGIRPDQVVLSAGSGPAPGFLRQRVRIDLVQPTGSRSFASFSFGGTSFTAELPSSEQVSVDSQIDIDFDLNRAVVVERASERVIA